ncbi:MAG: hypothetical protein CR217_11010 [Beijerinckiaceae bacterium]|nr:MAG: hypothetical protein CR217_11010 [Beijerinckiaceae bacterium]
MAQCGVDIDPLVGQQPVHLLDRMLGHQAARQGEALADRIDRQRSGLDDADGLPRSKGFGSVSSSAPRIMVARAEIRDLPARGNQYMTCADCEATPACIDSFSTESAQKVGSLCPASQATKAAISLRDRRLMLLGNFGLLPSSTSCRNGTAIRAATMRSRNYHSNVSKEEEIPSAWRRRMAHES